MYFDRFDVIEAYYVFSHQGLNCPWWLERKIDSTLAKLRFRPCLRLRSEAYPKHLSENGKLIYMNLIRQYCGTH